MWLANISNKGENIMSNQQDSSSKGWIIIITSVIGVIGTIAVSYFAFRGAIFPKQLEIEAAQTAQSVQSTQVANNIWITQTAQSIEVTRFAESIKATQTSVALSSNSTTSQSVQATQTPLPTAVPPTVAPPPTVYVPPTPIVYDLTILANQSWTGTGIKIETGKHYSITATGEWISSGDQVPDNANGRQPDPCSNSLHVRAVPVLNAACASLIAKIGFGSPFFVGDQHEFTSTEEGTLFLGPNDSSVGLSDNSGYLNVRVEITVP